MAYVTYITGDCPGCGKANCFGNIEVFNTRLIKGCKSCRYTEQIELPPLKKKILYLDQFFFSHAFRGKDDMFLEAAKRIMELASLQLLAVPYSSIHEDETHQWERRDDLFKFIKNTSHGIKFRHGYDVTRQQIFKAFETWLANETTNYIRDPSDAFRESINSWDPYIRIEVGKYRGDIELIRDLKNQSVTGLVGLFDDWMHDPGSFDQDTELEYEAAARKYMQTYLDYIAKMANGDLAAYMNAPIMTMTVEGMMRRLPKEKTWQERLDICWIFFQSNHFKAVPHHWLSSRMFAVLKEMVKNGAYSNREEAIRRLAGFYYDVQHIGIYSPYCDAFVVDKPMAAMVAHQKISIEKSLGVKIFSRENWDDFLAWLDELKKSMSIEHADTLKMVYPN